MYGWVKKYVGIPFVSGGRTVDGCDCYGLVRLILQNEYGYRLPELSGLYDDALDKAEIQQVFSKEAPLLCGRKISSPREKSVALIASGGLATHVALYAGDGCIIHTMNRIGTVCENLERVHAVSILGWYDVSKSYITGERLFGREKGI